MNRKTLNRAAMLGAALGCAAGMAAEIPAVLPRPDTTPPSAGKVKVYLLAGQSNMVGFGYLQGSQPVYPSIYLSADPRIKAGRMPVGPSALLPHGIYQTAGADAPEGAKVAIYPGAYRDGTDYEALKPLEETTVALGTVDARLPSIDSPHTVVAKAFIEVPMSGTHEIHAGFEDSSHAVVSLNGKEVYRKEPGEDAVIAPVFLEQGKRHPVSITYMMGGSAAFWLKHVDLKGQGDLASLIKEGKYTWFADDEGKWTVRNDVTYWETRISKEGGSGGPLSATSNGKFIGPEVPFGHVMGTFHEEPVLLIESSMGNRALGFDFRPPSSGKTEEEKANEWCGKEYELMVRGVRNTLENIGKIVPGYQGQGYEIAGFVWWQGHKDKDVPKEVYEKHLVNLIRDLRKEFGTPAMPAVVATVGFGGMDMEPGHFMTWEAQMAVGDPRQHPEFAGNVASVDTRPFWRARGESPTNTGFHYNHNAETFVLTGDALGRAMVALHGGKAAMPTVAARPQLHPDVATIFSDAVTGNFNKAGPHHAPEYYREMGPALKPILLGEMVPEFLESAFAPDSRGNLKGIVTGQKPARMPLDIRGDLDTLMDYYAIAGVANYGWKPFGPEMRTASWSYFSFDPPEKQDLAKSNRYREITYPAGMERWFAPDFDPVQAGWKTGHAPFGQMGGKLDRLRPRCSGTACGCSEIPATLWEKEVLLMRQTFELPPVKEGHVYRLILGGAGCDRTGEGFAIYVNGKPLTRADGGFFRNPGIRGAYLSGDLLPEFKGGKVTIAVLNFLRYTYFNNVTVYHGPHPDYRGKPVPPHGHVSLWMEEAELSPATLRAAGME
jgi:alpha-galactosidase